MADSVIQPAASATEASGEPVVEPKEQHMVKAQEEASTAAGASSISPPIIWTPRFIVVFALTLVIGLSAESIIVLGWISHDYSAQWPLLAHIALIFACLVAIILATRSRWIRTGGIFGCIWAIFTAINLIVTFYTLDPTSPIPAYLNASICSALLGCYICLSIDRVPFTAWDTWFFRLALITAICGVPLAYFIKPAIDRSVSIIESAVAAIGLVFCILVWWLRPSCWKTQPGPTFFFGLTPTIILLLSIPSLGSGSTNVFLSQVALLSFLLGALRILQGELKRKHTSSH